MFENELNKVYKVIDEKDCTIASLKPQNKSDYVRNWLAYDHLSRRAVEHWTITIDPAHCFGSEMPPFTNNILKIRSDELTQRKTHVLHFMSSDFSS